ncbi:MAG: hypothetical protein QOF71_1947 [Candidatus Eremiobacteraeota bacterium]|jgi:hypothetical protein|nr:hypothetical protein [Candidatus Eremiobacteraeota bacterium]
MSTVPRISVADQQHMLMVFLPLYKGTLKRALHAAHALAGITPAGPGNDDRADKGVHFAMFYGIEAEPNPSEIVQKPPLPVPTFQNAPGKDLLIAQAFYDGDFAAYIGAFTNEPATAAALTALLYAVDESGIVPDSDPTSAKAIIAAGGVAVASAQFNCLLMRYNFGNPVLPGTSGAPSDVKANYGLIATFPGLTVGKLLAKNGYPNSQTLWPFPPPPKIDFQTTPTPQCPP